MGRDYRRRLREALADSGIAPVAIAVLLVRSIALGARGAFNGPFLHVTDFIVNTIAIGGIPSGRLSLGNWLELVPSIVDMFTAAMALAAAFFLSHWMYRTGPIRSLSECARKFVRTTDA